MSAVTSPYGPTEMLSDSMYNYTTPRRDEASTADQDSGDSQFDSQSQLHQLTTSMQKPRNKRKNFKPINSRMAEVSDDDSDHDEQDDETDIIDETNSNNDILEYERKTLLAPNDDSRTKQRLNNNEASPMDLSVATRPPSSDDDDDDDDDDEEDGSSDSIRHKCILEQLRSQKLYSPGAEVQSPMSDSSEKSEVGMEHESSHFDDEHANDEAELETLNDNNIDDNNHQHHQYQQRKPYENMREFAESTMQELLAIYGLASGELAKTVSRQLPSQFLNPHQMSSQQHQISRNNLNQCHQPHSQSSLISQQSPSQSQGEFFR
ncbi:hypothetical protein PV328_004843 [Microctonus aethiopoides]|uniref:Uncharacterized protein n=1 Tax=Microctonus aethiopoides TaxID=144406 RepID=A0AA39KM49_9HYME|nr:hypothetical protein PV328_004843 [Microctonus aethiopoides]